MTYQVPLLWKLRIVKRWHVITSCRIVGHGLRITLHVKQSFLLLNP